MQRSGRLRLVLGLLAVLSLLTGARAAESIWLTPRAGGSTLEAVLEITQGDAPAASLLRLPEGTRAVTVIAAGDAPLAAVHVGPIMTMRDTPVAPLWIDPSAVPALRAAGVTRVTVRLSVTDSRAPQVARSGRAGGAARGGYLIITPDAYADVLQPLVEWKRACGYDVNLRRTSETGRTFDEIRAFVRNAYETWEIPPLYLLLVGDVEEVPSGDLTGNVSDHYYACVDGDDFLGDLYVGRFSAKNATEVALQVAKTVGYESRPDTTGVEPGDEGTWFNRALMVAGNYGSSTPVPVCQWVGDELEKIGFAHIYGIYYPPFSDGCSQTYGCPVGEAIDHGVSIVNYRGWARENPPGWDVPDYTSEDIVRLANGWKLPFVFSIVCNNGDFGRANEDCFGEAWVKAGTADAPLGAVGFIGTAEHWSRTRWNDRIDLGLFEALCYDGVHQVGPMLASATTALLAYFPTEIYLADVPEEEAVEFYTYVYNILADPSLTLWTARPRALQVEGLPEDVPAGTNWLGLRVTEAVGGSAVAGAHVAVEQDGALIGYGTTDDGGDAIVGIDLVSTSTLTCTVTGVNLCPWRATANIAPVERALTCIGAEVAGSGVLVPGQAVDMQVRVRNTGGVDLPSATATLGAPAGVEVLDGLTQFGPIAAGATATALSPVRVRPANDTEDGVLLRFTLTPTAGGELLPTSEFRLATAAPACMVDSLTDGGDGVFDAGEEFDLVLTLRNQGHTGGGTLAATLDPLAPGSGATVLDAHASFGAIAPGEAADNAADPLRLRLDGTLATGTVIPLALTLTGSEGPVCHVATNLVVGVVGGGAPTGPDAYGYYAYDSADIDYRAQAPAYRWIEISTRYGGPGTRLPIDIDDRVPQIVQLPFTFTYYGQPYDSALVSDNGWLAFDTTYFYDTRNWAMPDRWGGACQVAAFWDNLNPGAPGTDGIYAWHDVGGHRFVVEWSRLRNFEETANHYQSFQIVLCDPAWYPTGTGDGEILFQYRQIVNDDYKTMYSTVGIEDQSEEIGLEYSYCNQYAPGAVPLAPGLAIRITTDPPVYEPIASPRLAEGPVLRLLSPNPSPEGAVLLLRAERGGPPNVAVYDATGRRVRLLDGVAQSAPTLQVLAWDGRDALGRRVPSGVYWLRPASSAERRGVRMTIVR